MADALGNYPEHASWLLPAIDEALVSESDEQVRQVLAESKARLTNNCSGPAARAAEPGRKAEVDATGMAKLIVVTGLDQLPPTERWLRLIAPLAEELEYSGLGELPDLESLRREADQRGILEATEVAVTLVNFDYGRPLVGRVVGAAGIKRGKPVVPVRWHEYHCGEYFTSALGEQGYWDEPGQYWYIWPAERIYEDTGLQFLVIGGPGVDGIDWGYRRGHSGLWAYPIDGEFVWLAPTAQALLQGWLSGAISM